MPVEYQEIKMYADGKLNLIQKKIKQTLTKKQNFHIKFIQNLNISTRHT